MMPPQNTEIIEIYFQNAIAKLYNTDGKINKNTLFSCFLLFANGFCKQCITSMYVFKGMAQRLIKSNKLN